MTNSDGGKGSRQRRSDVKPSTFEDNWDTIFKKKCQKKCEKDTATNSCLGCGRSMKEITKNGNT